MKKTQDLDTGSGIRHGTRQLSLRLRGGGLVVELNDFLQLFCLARCGLESELVVIIFSLT